MKKTPIKVFLCLLGLFFLTALLLITNKVLSRPKPIPVVVKSVTIREGLASAEISRLLRDEGVFVKGEILPKELEGKFFPDTYEFYIPSSLDFVLNKISENFERKVLPIIPAGENINEILSVASLVEEEAAFPEDKMLVSGIIWKRLKSGMPLQVDSSVCYVKVTPCHPITKTDLQMDTPYNTYLYRGLPPSPVSNPGLDSIKASIGPEKSKFWYYISDPNTQKMIYAVTLDEHNTNVAKYLK